jgi:hypothetical protein
MKKRLRKLSCSLFNLLLCPALLSFAPVTAVAENITYPDPDSTLQNISVGGGGEWGHSVAPSGSDSGKSNSLSSNKVTINGDVPGAVSGAVNTVDANAVINNQVIVNSGTVGGEIFGGLAASSCGDVTATGNIVTISGGTVGGNVFGGYAHSSSSSATTTGNTVTISGGTVGYAHGGYAYSDSGTVQATGNAVTISGDAQVGYGVYGGFAYSGFGDVTATATATANNNTVTISGGTVGGNVYGGYAYSGSGDTTATGNTVTISGTPTLTNSTLYGGGGTYDAFTGNTLNLHSANLTVGGLYNFENLNFYVPTTLANGGTMLTVTGTADLTDGAGRSATVNVGIDGASSPLRIGDHIVLIDAGALISNSGLNPTSQGMVGVILQYDFDIKPQGDQLWAILAGIHSTPQSESLTEGSLAGMGLLNQGADLAAGAGMNAAMSAAYLPNTGYGLGIFGTASGGWSRYETGSSVDVSGISLMAGVSKRIDTQPGILVVGAFFEYGNGSYDT